jgi:hypothetical protein
MQEILGRKPEGKRLLGRHKCRWKNHIKMDLKICVKVWTGFSWLWNG